jgi:hypothetical protein
VLDRSCRKGNDRGRIGKTEEGRSDNESLLWWEVTVCVRPESVHRGRSVVYSVQEQRCRNSTGAWCGWARASCKETIRKERGHWKVGRGVEWSRRLVWCMGAEGTATLKSHWEVEGTKVISCVQRTRAIRRIRMTGRKTHAVHNNTEYDIFVLYVVAVHTSYVASLQTSEQEDGSGVQSVLFTRNLVAPSSKVAEGTNYEVSKASWRLQSW